MSTYSMPEEIPLTNDDEAARKATAYPTLRVTGPEEYIKFRVMTEEAVIIEKGLFPGSFAVRLNVAPVDGDDNAKTPTTRLELVLPIVNPGVDGHTEPDTGKSCERYFTAVDPKTYSPLPQWNKMTKQWVAADGSIVPRETYDTMKRTLYAKIIKTLRERWNAIRKGDNQNFVNDMFYAQVKAGGKGENAGKYRNVINVVGEVPTNGTLLTDGFKSTLE